MDRQNFKDQIFNEMPEAVVCSNFENCTFNSPSHFERCNLTKCVFCAGCTFDRSNVIDEEEFDRMKEDRERMEREMAEEQ